jgi:hypothetical protein
MHYTCHFDFPNNQWNCFEIVDGREEYVCSFPTSIEAVRWCVEMERRLEICTKNLNTDNAL